MMEAKCSRSGADRYRCCLNRRSSSYVCALLNSTRRFRFLCTAPLPSDGCPPAPDEPDRSCSPPVAPDSSSKSSSISSPSTSDGASLPPPPPTIESCPPPPPPPTLTDVSAARPLGVLDVSVRSVTPGDVLSGLACWAPWVMPNPETRQRKPRYRFFAKDKMEMWGK